MNTKEAYKFAYGLVREKSYPGYVDDWWYAFNRVPKDVQEAAFESLFQRERDFKGLTKRQYRNVLRRLETAGLERLKKHIYPFAFYGQF